MADTEVAFEEIRAQTDALRAADARTPIGVHLGVSQREAVEAHIRQVTGQADVGPLLSFQGLAVKASKRADHMVMLYAEGEDPDPIDPPVEIPPTPPAADLAGTEAAPSA